MKEKKSIIERVRDSVYLFNGEFIKFKVVLKEEINIFFSKRMFFFEYLSQLIWDKDKNNILNFLKLITFYFFFKFVFDILLFVLIFIWRFYFLFLNFFFIVWIKIVKYFFNNKYIIRFFVIILEICRYFLLFVFFLRLHKWYKKKNSPWYLIILEGFLDFVNKVLKIRIPWRYIFLIFPLQILEIIVIIVWMINSFFVDIIFVYILRIIYIMIRPFVNLYNTLFLFYFIFSFRFLEEFKVKDAHLIEIASHLQKDEDYEPEICIDEIKLKKAFKDYQKYKNDMKKLRYDFVILNDKGIHIYIYLRKLLSGTKFQNEAIPIITIFHTIYPWYFILIFWYTVIYFYFGTVFLIYICFLPLIISIVVPLLILEWIVYELIPFIDMVFFEYRRTKWGYFWKRQFNKIYVIYRKIFRITRDFIRRIIWKIKKIFTSTK